MRRSTNISLKSSKNGIILPVFGLLLFLSILPNAATAQFTEQIGDPLNEVGSKAFGHAIAFSSNGKILAVADPEFDNEGGRISVYRRNGFTWSKIGNDILGPIRSTIIGDQGNFFGASIAISRDGSVLAIGMPEAPGGGAVRVYRNNNDTWEQVGNDLGGSKVGELFGMSVSLSDDGTILAAGTNNYDKEISETNIQEEVGIVRIYNINKDDWTISLVQDIEGSAEQERLGLSIDISQDGKAMVIGALHQLSTVSGIVKVYRKIRGTWRQIGDNITSEVSGDRFGNSVSISANGSTIAIGAPNNRGEENELGYVQVFSNSNYTNTNSNWVQKGANLTAGTGDNNFGTSIDLSADGAFVAIASSNSVSNDPSKATIYQFENDDWNLYGTQVSTNPVSRVGTFPVVAMDASATLLALGETELSSGLGGIGVVRVFGDCPPGTTCEYRDVDACGTSFTTDGGHEIFEDATYTEIVGNTRTTYFIAFGKEEVNTEVFTDAVIASSGTMAYEAKTNVTGVLSFDNSQDYWVDMNSLQDDLNGTSRSIFMWIKTGNVSSSEQILFGINPANNGNTITNLFIDNNGNNLETNDGGNNRSASFDVSGEVWNHVGYTYDANTNETVIYVNGIAQNTYTNNQLTTATSRYSLGQEFDNNESNHYNGDMAEISVWNEALTGAEVRVAMREKITDSHPKYANLVGYYSIFGECNDDTAVLKDHSGNGNDGVMKNGFVQDFKNADAIEGFNSVGWFPNVSWKKDGVEIAATRTFTSDLASGSYELTALTDFLQSNNSWFISENENATTIDNLPDETLCEDDAITRTVTANAVNYLDFEEDDAGGIEVNSLTDDQIGTDRSVFMWVNKESNVGNSEVFSLLTFNGPDVEEEISRLSIHSNEKLSIWDGDSRLDGTTTLDNDIWYHVGYTYDATTFETKLYVNGVLENTGTREMPLVDGYYASLGHSFIDNGKDNFFDGKMAEVTVWDKLLTKEEVTALMAAAPAHDATNLVAAYGTLQTIADNQLRDLTANGNNGISTHSAIIVSDLEETITDYDASNNYTFSWKKEGTEFDTDATGNITIDEGTTNYSVTYGTPLFQKTDEFSLSYTNLLPTQPVSQTAGVTGSVTFEVDEVAGATYQWFEKNLEVEAEDFGNGEQGFPQSPGLISDILVDDSKLYISTRGGLAVSTDEGQTWTTLDQSSGLVNNNINGFAVDGDKYFVGHGNNGGLSISLDAGQNWSNITAQDNGFANSNNPQFVTIIGGVLYVATDNGISVSSDNGQTFTTVTTNQNGFPNTRKVNDIFGDGNKIYAATDGGFTVSEDGGINWQSTVLGEDGFPAGEKALSVYADGDNIYVGTQTSGLVISRDGGQTWTNTAILLEGYPDSETIRNLIAVDGNLYAGTDDGLFLSQDQGATWNALLENKLIFGLAGNSTAIYAGDNSGNLYRFNTLVELSASEQTEQNSSSSSGVTTRELTLSNLILDQDMLQYYVVVTKDGCSQQSSDVTLTVLDIPVVSTFTPANQAIDVAIDTELTMEFSKTVSKGAGELKIFNYATDALVQTFTADDLTIDGTTVSVTPGTPLDYSTHYYITYDADLVLDENNAGNFALTGKDSWSFHTICEPLVLSEPEDQEKYIGQSATFSVPEVAGATYQWFEKGEDTWNTISPGQNGFLVSGFATSVYTEGQNIYVGTSSGLAISTDGGSSWTSTTRGQNGFADSNQVNSVYAEGENIYIGTHAGLSISTDGGNSWTTTTNGQNGFAPTNFSPAVFSVYAKGNNIYAGTSAGLAISTDGGSNWTTTTSGQNGFAASNSVESVYAEGNKIYAGTNAGLSISTDGGASWTTTTSGQNGFATISRVLSIYAEGENIYAGINEGYLSISTNGGSNWTTIAGGQNGFASNFAVYSVFAEGENIYAGTNGGGLLISTDGGSSWENITSGQNGFATSNLVYTVYADGDKVYAGTSGGSLSILTSSSALADVADNTASNQIQGVDTNTLTISNLTEDFDQSEYFVVVTKGNCEETSETVTLSVTCEPLVLQQPTDQDGYVTGSVTFSVPEVSGASYEWFRSVDERTRIGSANSKGYAGSFLTNSIQKDGDRIVAGTPTGASISSDGGQNWTTPAAGENGFSTSTQVQSVYLEGDKIYVGTREGLSISTDGGLNWTTIISGQNGFAGSSIVNSVFADGDKIYAGTGAGLSISSDGGDNWTTVVAGNNGLGHSSVNSVYAEGDKIYVTTFYNGVSISTDGGVNWTTTAPGENGFAAYADTRSVFAEGNRVYVATQAGLSISSDGGANWTTVNSGENGFADTDKVSSVYSVGNQVYAGTGAGLSISADGGRSWTTTSVNTVDNVVLSLYPEAGVVYLGTSLGLYEFIRNESLENSIDGSVNNAISGFDSRELTISNLTEDLDQTEYVVVVTKGECQETSNTVTLTIVEEPPFITTLSPADDEIDVPRFTTPSITFDKAIEKGTGNIEIRKAADDQLLTTIAVNTVLVSISDKTATLMLGDSRFEFGTEYYIIIPEGAFNSTDGGVFEGISDKTEWSFTIIDAPAIEAITPADDATDVDPAINEGGMENAFSLLFNRAVEQGPGGGFGLYKVEGDELVGITANVGGDNSPMKLEDDDRTVKMYFVEPTESLSATNVTPEIALEPATEYYIRTVGDPFDDFSISDKTTWNFTTTIAGPPVEVVSFSPGNSATGISTDFNVGGMNFSITFQEPMALDLSAQGGSAEIYNASTNELLGSNHFPVGSGTFLTDLSTDGLTFSTTFINTQGSGVVELVDGQGYYILISKNHINRASDGAAYIISDPTEWSFTVGEAADPTFTHTSFSPINGATEVETDILLNPNFQNVQIDEPLRINFEDPISAGTSGTIGIYKASDDSPVVEYDMATENIGSLQLFGGQISNSVSLSNITIVQNDVFAGPMETVRSGAIYISSDNITLENNTEYYVLIDRGAVVDQEDATIVYEGISDKTEWSFTTEPAAQSSFSDVGLYPTNGQTEVPININELDFNGLFPMAPEGQVFGHVFYFERRVSAGDGGKISLYKSSDNSLVYELNTADDPILSMEGLSSLAADKAYLFYAFEVSFIIINSDVPLETNTEYYWLIDEGVVEDPGTDEVFAGISDPTAWSFTMADIQPLVITGFKPDNNGADVDIDRYLQFEFDQSIVLGTGNVTVYDQNDQVFEVIDVATGRVTSESNLRVNPSKFYTPNDTYYVLADAGVARGLNGAAFTGISDKTTWSFTIEDYVELDANEFFPEPGSQKYDVGRSKKFEVDFDKQVELSDDSEVYNGNLRVYKASNDALLATIELSDMDFGEETAKFDVSGLESGTEYYILFDNGLFVDLDEPESFAGISDPTVWRFSTLALPSTPMLTATSPADDATDVAISANITLTYSENIQAYVYGEGGTTANNVVLYDANDNVVETFPANTLTYSGSKVTINPSSDLAYNTAYYLLIENEAFISNNEVKTAAITDPTVISFTTTSQPNTAPVASSVSIAGSLEANLELTGSYNYSDADSDAESGSTLQWYVADNASGANRTAISGATSGTYTLTSSEVGKYITFAVTPNDGTDAGTQTFATYTGPVVAAVVPTVISTIPADGSVDVAKDANLSFTMSETVTKGTGNITLTPATGTATVIDVTSNEVAISGADVTINPDSDLLEGQFYTVTFDASAFVDADGNNSAGLTSQTTWNFTIKEANVAPVAQAVTIKKSLVVDGVLEGSYAYSDANDDPESGTTFQWYRADNSAGANRVAIAGATTKSYTVVNDDNGKYLSFEVIPNDGSLAGTAEESAFFGPIIINDGVTNIPPAFTSDALTSIFDDEAYSYTVTYEDLNNDVPTLTKTTGPDWLTVNGLVLLGNPTSANVGDHDIVLTLDDQNGGTITQEFTMTVLASNTAPSVNGVEVSGTTTIDEVLTATYNFIDAELDADNSTFKWYRSDDNSGTGKTEISGATTTSYTLVATDAGKYVSFEVTPNDGKVSGTDVESVAVGPIAKKTPSLSLSDIAKTYGDADFDLSASTNSSGAITYTFDNDQTGAAINGSTVTLGNAGEITVNVSLAEDAEYTARQVQGTITVAKKAIALKATDAGKVVDDTNPTLEFTVTSGSIVGDDEVVTVSRDAGEAPGTYAINLIDGTDAANYEITAVPGVFTISQRSLTITAQAATKTYGDNDPDFAYSITSGSLNTGDELSGAVTRVEGEDVGTYALQSSLFNPNYDISFVSADLTIEKADLTATADDQTKYLGEANPELTISYSGFVNGDSKANITEPTIATTATESSPVGTYDITLSGGAAANYNLNLVNGQLTVEQRPFIITLDAKNAKGREVEVLGIIEGLTYDYTVDWGDGNIDTNLTEAAKHTYTSTGIFTIKVTGNYPGLQLKYYNIKSIEQWGSQEWESLENAIQHMNLTINATDAPDLSQGPSMAGMFRSTRVGSPDLTTWDVSAVTNISNIFSSTDFNGNVSNWNVSNVIDMSGAFSSSPFNGDISTWDVGNVTTMRDAFKQNENFSGDLSNWNMSSVTNTEFMFHSADAFNSDISSWDVSNVTDMTGMFGHADIFNQDISGWNVSNVVDMAVMFSMTRAFNQPLDAWDVSNVITMEGMFTNADAFNQDLSSWDVSKVEKFDHMFKQTDSFNGNITSWNVSSGTDFEEMFYGTKAFNQAIGNWNLASATNVRYMFQESEVFNQPLNDWRFPNLTSTEAMFRKSLAFNQDLNDWEMTNITRIDDMFEEAEAFNGNISDWDVSNVKNFDYAFDEAEMFNQDISAWDVSSGENFRNMFAGATSFNQDISAWDVSNGTNFFWMFNSATSFDQDISSWQLSKSTSFGSMLKNSGLSVENYDAFLISISEQELKTDVQFDVEGLQYCAGTAARQSLIDNLNWTIENDSQACSATVTIADVSANEDDGAITVTLTSDAFVVDGFTVDVSTSNGTAEAGTDYTAVTVETITFAGTVGETQSFTITPTVDSSVETDETLTISMSNLVTDAANTVTITDEATITILNDDVPVVSFNTTAQSSAESVTSSSIVVNLDQAGLSAATVDYTVSGTATGGGVDYTLANGSLSFAAGELSKTIDLTIVDDALIEENETVVISLSNASGASLGTNTLFTYTIVNNDAQVTIEDVSQFEDGESFLVTATLEGTIEGGFTVDLSTADGTATVADGDYTAVSGATLTFNGTDGEVQKLDIAPGVDSKLEADETFTVSLSNLFGTTANVVITDQAVLTIKNDDAAAVTLADASGNEGDGAITVTATLDNAVQGGFTLEVNTADGTATLADSDYTAVANKTLTFAGTAGETQTFTVTPTNDLVIEPNETLTVSMSNMSSSLAVDVSDAATVTIVNDDFNNAPTDIIISTASIAENNALDAAIGTLITTDADAGNTHTYALVSGAGDTDNAGFILEGSTLKANNTSFNFEDKASYSVRIETNDGEGGTFAKAFEITVTNVNEAPFTLSLTNATIDEADAAQEVGQLMSLDPDNGDSFTYSLVAGDADADNAQFAISGNTLSTAGAIDFEDGASRSIRVQVADAGGLTFEQTFSITIEDVVAEPVRNYTQNQPGADVKNVFSPNGDGVNETWVIEDLLDNPYNQVKIFAQGGKLIYSKVNYSNDWAGTFKDNPVPDGTYYYEILIFENEQSTSPARTIKGFLTIIRNR